MKVVKAILKILPHLIFPALVAAVLLWYVLPVRFLGGVKADRVGAVQLFDGNTGYELEITDRGRIGAILDNIHSFTFRKVRGKDGISFVEMGYRFRLIFEDLDGREIDRIIIDSEDIVRRDPFYYQKQGEGVLCYDELWQMIRQAYDYDY